MAHSIKKKKMTTLYIEVKYIACVVQKQWRLKALVSDFRKIIHILSYIKFKHHYTKSSSLRAKYKSEKGNKCRTSESTVHRIECTKERWLESNGWQDGDWCVEIDVAIYPKCPHIGNGFCVGLLAQFKDQSAETLWLKLTAVWEMPNGAGRMRHTPTHTHIEMHFWILSITH